MLKDSKRFPLIEIHSLIFQEQEFISDLVFSYLRHVWMQPQEMASLPSVVDRVVFEQVLRLERNRPETDDQDQVEFVHQGNNRW